MRSTRNTANSYNIQIRASCYPFPLSTSLTPATSIHITLCAFILIWIKSPWLCWLFFPNLGLYWVKIFLWISTVTSEFTATQHIFTIFISKTLDMYTVYASKSVSSMLKPWMSSQTKKWNQFYHTIHWNIVFPSDIRFHTKIHFQETYNTVQLPI